MRTDETENYLQYGGTKWRFIAIIPRMIKHIRKRGGMVLRHAEHRGLVQLDVTGRYPRVHRKVLRCPFYLFPPPLSRFLSAFFVPPTRLALSFFYSLPRVYKELVLALKNLRVSYRRLILVYSHAAAFVALVLFTKNIFFFTRLGDPRTNSLSSQSCS